MLVRPPPLRARQHPPLVLGVGVNIAIFTIFNAAVLRPLAVDEPDRVVRLYEDSRDAARRKAFSFAEYIDDRDRKHGLQ